MTPREQEILYILKADPLISQQALADKLGISRSATASHLANLVAKGLIQGRGYILQEPGYCVVVGGANMDILGRPHKALVAATSNPGQISVSPGGVGRNIADNLARLGAPCYLLAPVGDDASGEELLELTQQAGVNTTHMVRLAGQSTSSYVSLLDSQGDLQLAIADMSILQAFGVPQLQPLLGLLQGADLVAVDTNLSEDCLAFMFSALTQQCLFVDTVSLAKASRIKPYLSHIHTLKPNLAEAQSIAGMPADLDPSSQQLSALANWYHHQGVQRLFVSLGKRGLFYSAHGEGHKTEAFEMALPSVPVINVNGAGDAMMAAICYAWTQGLPVHKTCAFALAAAQLTVSHKATINPHMSSMRLQALLQTCDLIQSIKEIT
jgi:pseudouridine kinase